MSRLVPFALEDFFDEFEHRTGLINLASSDAQPWSAHELRSRGVPGPFDAVSTLHYPDVKKLLYPRLQDFCRPPAGMVPVATNGASEAISLVMHDLAVSRAPGDDRPVAIPVPAYDAFRGLATLLGLPIETYEYSASLGWAPDRDTILRLSRRCSALVLTNPHNPSGHVLDAEFLRQLAAEMSARESTMIVDEVFRVDGETDSAVALGPSAVVIGSLSKTFGVPGLRLGWAAASQERAGRLRTLQQYLTLSLNVAAVALGAEILNRTAEFSRAGLICKNRRILVDVSKTHSDILAISEPRGGTTVCLTIKLARDEIDLFNRFIQHGVLLAPGAQCFGFATQLPWFRLGYATESSMLERGLEIVSGVLKAGDKA
jgi:aspartate/methionine/tyrosine aminotransferase